MASIYSLRVACDNCDAVETPDPPNNRLLWILGMAILFGGIGLAIGSVFGIATAGFGFVATVVTVPAGLYVGYKVGQIGAELMDGPTCPECGTTHDTGGLLPF
jgi:hypothetical protein